MKTVRWTSLILLLALVLPIGALAVPRRPQAQCVLRFELLNDGLIPDPFGRWLTELAAMTVVTLEHAQWYDGEALYAQVRMADQDAFDFTLFSGDGHIMLQSGLMGEGAARLNALDAESAGLLMAACRAALSNRGCSARTLGLSCSSMVETLDAAAQALARWGESSADTPGELCGALAEFVRALAELAGQGESERELLRVHIDYFQPASSIDTSPASTPAPEELSGVFTCLALEAVFESIAALDS